MGKIYFSEICFYNLICSWIHTLFGIQTTSEPSIDLLVWTSCCTTSEYWKKLKLIMWQKWRQNSLNWLYFYWLKSKSKKITNCMDLNCFLFVCFGFFKYLHRFWVPFWENDDHLHFLFWNCNVCLIMNLILAAFVKGVTQLYRIDNFGVQLL